MSSVEGPNPPLGEGIITQRMDKTQETTSSKMSFDQIFDIMMETIHQYENLIIQVTTFSKYQQDLIKNENILLSQYPFLTDEFNTNDMSDDEKQDLQSFYDKFNSYVVQPAYQNTQSDLNTIQAQADSTQSLIDDLTSSLNSLMDSIKSLMDTYYQTGSAPFR